MTGNDNEGSKSVYGSDVEIVSHDAASLTSPTASSKVRISDKVRLGTHFLGTKSSK